MIARNLARYLALPMLSAGIIGGAALGMAGAANAGTYSPPRPGIVATPGTYATPPMTATPGKKWHRDRERNRFDLSPGFSFSATP